MIKKYTNLALMYKNACYSRTKPDHRLECIVQNLDAVISFHNTAVTDEFLKFNEWGRLPSSKGPKSGIVG